MIFAMPAFEASGVMLLMYANGSRNSSAEGRNVGHVGTALWEGRRVGEEDAKVQVLECVVLSEHALGVQLRIVDANAWLAAAAAAATGPA